MIAVPGQHFVRQHDRTGVIKIAQRSQKCVPLSSLIFPFSTAYGILSSAKGQAFHDGKTGGRLDISAKNNLASPTNYSGTTLKKRPLSKSVEMIPLLLSESFSFALFPENGEK